MQIEDVSIIVPTKNESKNIERFLQSIPPEAQLIIVDSSTDDTREKVRTIRPRNTQIIEKNVNIATARQIGAEAAESEWLVFTDADMTFADDYFDLLPKYDNYDVVYGAKTSLDNYTHYYEWFQSCQLVFDKIGVPMASGSNLVIRKQALLASGGFDVRLPVNEDSEIAWRIKRLNYKTTFAPELQVIEHDHRRLDKGIYTKTLHTMVRCTLLYFELMPEKWRYKDWGYWA
jgi:glycosyltransferase involved in cell wall biosynthesis